MKAVRFGTTMLIGALAIPLGACAGPSLEAFNDRGGVNSSIADVLAVAERYCAGIGRKAKLGTSSIGMTSMNVSWPNLESPIRRRFGRSDAQRNPPTAARS